MNLTSIRTVGIAAIFTFCFVSASAQTYGPGGIATGVALWLDASQVTATDNATVTSWPDASGNGSNFTTGTGGTFRTAIQNGKSALYFNGTNQYLERAYTAGINPTALTLFAVTRVETSATYKSPITSRNDDRGYMVYSLPTSNQWEFWYGTGGGVHSYDQFGSGQATTNAWSVAEYTATAANLEIFLNNTSITTSNATYRPNNTRPVRIAAGNTDVNTVDFFFKGYIAEIAIYNQVVSAAKRNIIANALGWKYGVTLTSNAAYPIKLAPATYSNDPGGVGRVSNADIVNDSQAGIVRVFNLGTSLADNEYLFWGHDGGALSASTTDLPGSTIIGSPGGVAGTYTVQRRLARVWKAYERNNAGTSNTMTIDVGTMSISFDLNSVPGTKRLQDLVLITDRGNNGFADETYTAGSSSSGIFLASTYTGGIVTFTNVNLKENDSFTVASLNGAQTPLPVTLLNLTADLTAESQVNVNWQTATEHNSRYFIVQRSSDASNWTAIDTVAASGNSTSLLSYASTDVHPLSGQLYYRVRSVDLDETFEYSPIVTVQVPVTFGIYPNPASKEVFVETDQDISQPLLLGDSQGLIRVVPAEQVDDHTLRLDTSSLRPGVYILQLGTRRSRLVIL